MRGDLVRGANAASSGLAAPERLRALAELDVLDRPAEPAFDRLTTLAARALDVPIAIFTIVDECRQFFASAHGLPEPWRSRRETPLSHSFCQHVVLERAPLVVRDAHEHPLVRDNLAIGELGVVAYLGQPVAAADGTILGSFAVADSAPRDWSARDIEIVAGFAALASRELLLGRAARMKAALLEHASEAFVVLDREWRVTSINPAAERVLEVEAAATLGKVVWEVLPAVLARRLEPGIRRAVASRRVVEHELTCDTGPSRAPARPRWLDLRIIPTRDGAALLARDVTVRKRAELALQESEARFRTLAEAAPIGIAVGTPAFAFTYANPRLREIAGLDPATISPEAWIAMIHPDDRGRVEASRAGFVTGATDLHVAEYRLVRPDGRVAWVRDHMQWRRLAGGTRTSLIVVLEDITAERTLQERLQHAQRLEAVGQLAGGIAHEFNNLLTVVSGSVDFAHDRLPPDHPAQRDLQQVAQAAVRARELVRQLLAFGRRQVLRPQPVDLGAFVRARCDSLLASVLGDDIECVVEIDGEPAAPLVVRADPAQLDEALVNLALNARHAMRTSRHGSSGSGGTLSFAVDAVSLDEHEAAAWAPLGPGRHVRLRVRDTGHGMDAHERRHAFEPFFTTKEVGEGSGLGLSAVEGIVAQSGGAIRVESAPGAGTTFTLLFRALDYPAMPAHHAATDVRADARADARTPAVTGAEPDDDRGHVLLVDDNDDVRRVSRRALERAGYRVAEARDATEALQRWREARAGALAGADAPPRITAVVTDVRMPHLPGTALARVMRRDAPALPVVFISGSPVAPGEVVADAHTAFIAKPFSIAELAEVLAAVIAGHADRLPPRD